MKRALLASLSFIAFAASWGGPAQARQDELGPYGQVPGPQAHCRVQGSIGTEADPARPPLFEGLGGETFTISTANPTAQKYFNQGLRLAWAFNHAEARRAFVEAQRLDPSCAACAWGEALVLGPNINKPMDPADNSLALAALGRASRLAANAADKEQALIEALKNRYSKDNNADRAAMDASYAEAMTGVAKLYPDDPHIQVLAAEALMDTQPWDYWQADHHTPKGRHGETVALLERVLAKDPNHAGAIHLYIHAVEASDNPERALEPARRLAARMPAAGHIVHMPAHIYYRLGLWRDSAQTNRDAVVADENYFRQVGMAPGIYRDGYYPHNIHFLMVSSQMSGDGDTALIAADKLAATITTEGASAVPWAQPIKASPYFAHAQFSSPDVVFNLPDPGGELPYVQALWHFARGSAAARQGNAEEVKAEAAVIRHLAQDPAIAQLTGQGVPAGEVLALAQEVLYGKAAQVEGHLDQAIDHYRRAVAAEDQLSYTEPPWWYMPVRQSLGAALLMAGNAQEAQGVFREALVKVPNNGWALWGLAETQMALGDPAGAAETQRAFRDSWSQSSPPPQLAAM